MLENVRSHHVYRLIIKEKSLIFALCWRFMIGKYQILEELGRGAMGVVYKAIDPDIERVVAIKTLHANLASGNMAEELLGRFKREAQAAAKCSHVNIVSVLEYGEHDAMPYIVMEFVEGKPLSDVIAENSSLSLKFVFSVLSQLFKALNAAHSAGIVHRDIKPANVMVMADGVIKLADFGIARVSSSAHLTQVGMMIGTPRYMSPEQAMGQEVDVRADIFALSMVWMDMLAKLPKGSGIEYCTLNHIDGLMQANNIDYELMLPLPIVNVLHKGLAANPGNRYANIKAFVKDVQALLPAIKSIKAGVDPDLQATVLSQTVTKSSSTSQSTHLGQLNTTGNLNSGIDTNSSLSVDMITLADLTKDYQTLIGVEADELIRSSLREVISFSELIYTLANQIPNKRKRKKFLQSWEQ